MTDPLPLKVGDRAYCIICQEAVVITSVDGDWVNHHEKGNAIPRKCFRKLPDRKEGE